MASISHHFQVIPGMTVRHLPRSHVFDGSTGRFFDDPGAGPFRVTKVYKCFNHYRLSAVTTETAPGHNIRDIDAIIKAFTYA